MKYFSFFIILVLCCPKVIPAQVVFKNVTSSSGLFTHTTHTPSFSSIWVDVDNDDLLDLYVAHGDNDFPEFNLLFHNLGNGKFKDITKTVFPQAIESYTGQMCWGDFNNDGFIDCYESHFNTEDDWLWLNNGDLTFSDARNLFTEPGLYATGAIFSDLNNDGKLDLLINTQQWQGSSVQINNGKSFDVATPFFNGGQGDEILAMFINDDSIPDYLFGNAKGLDSLFFSSGNGFYNFDNSFLGNVRTLSDYPGAAAFADIDNDGYPDLLVHYPDKLYVFHDLQGKSFVDWTHDLHLDSAKKGKHMCMFFTDFDNDGYLDLLLLNTDTTSDLYYGSVSGFKRSILPINQPAKGGLQNISITDYDNDGFMDIEHNAVGSISLWHNEGNPNRWLSITLRGHTANANGIGARVLAYENGRRQNREIGYSQGYYGYLPLLAHFGFGPSSCNALDIIDSVVIIWQPGGRQVLKDVRMNQIIVVDQDSGIVRSYQKTVAGGLGVVYPVALTSMHANPNARIKLPLSIYLPQGKGIDTLAVNEITFSIQYDHDLLDISPSKVAQHYTSPLGWTFKSSHTAIDTLQVTIEHYPAIKLSGDSTYLGTFDLDTYLGTNSSTLVSLTGFSIVASGKALRFCTNTEGSIITRVTVDTILAGVIPKKSTKELIISPNPSTSETTISWGDYDSKTQVRVLDMLGRVVYQTEAVSKTIIPANILAVGNYIVEVTIGNELAIGRLVIR